MKGGGGGIDCFRKRGTRSRRLTRFICSCNPPPTHPTPRHEPSPSRSAEIRESFAQAAAQLAEVCEDLDANQAAEAAAASHLHPSFLPEISGLEQRVRRRVGLIVWCTGRVVPCAVTACV